MFTDVSSIHAQSGCLVEGEVETINAPSQSSTKDVHYFLTRNLIPRFAYLGADFSGPSAVLDQDSSSRPSENTSSLDISGSRHACLNTLMGLLDCLLI